MVVEFTVNNIISSCCQFEWTTVNNSGFISSVCEGLAGCGKTIVYVNSGFWISPLFFDEQFRRSIKFKVLKFNITKSAIVCIS